MSDDELKQFATDFRGGILDGRSSEMTCFMVCAPLAGLLQMRGVTVAVEEGDLGFCNHFWLRLQDGRVLDPTADQFNALFSLALPPVYLGPPLANLHPRSSP